MKRALHNLELSRGGVSPTKLGIAKDVDGLAPACETKPGATKRELLGLVVPLEVLADVYVLKAVCTRSERGSDTDSAGSDAKWLGHLLLKWDGWMLRCSEEVVPSLLPGQIPRQLNTRIVRRSGVGAVDITT